MASPISAIVENKQEIYDKLQHGVVIDPIIAFYGITPIARAENEQEYKHVYDRLVETGHQVTNWEEEIIQASTHTLQSPIHCRVSSLVGMSQTSVADSFLLSMRLAFEAYSSEISSRQIVIDTRKIAEKKYK